MEVCDYCMVCEPAYKKEEDGNHEQELVCESCYNENLTEEERKSGKYKKIR